MHYLCIYCCREQNAGWHLMGNNIIWDNLRVPPVDTLPWVRHVSGCLQDLKPGDHIEIQWRARIDLPYGRFLIIVSLLLNFLLGTLIQDTKEKFGSII